MSHGLLTSFFSQHFFRISFSNFASSIGSVSVWSNPPDSINLCFRYNLGEEAVTDTKTSIICRRRVLAIRHVRQIRVSKGNWNREILFYEFYNGLKIFPVFPSRVNWNYFLRAAKKHFEGCWRYVLWFNWNGRKVRGKCREIRTELRMLGWGWYRFFSWSESSVQIFC